MCELSHGWWGQLKGANDIALYFQTMTEKIVTYEDDDVALVESVTMRLIIAHCLWHLPFCLSMGFRVGEKVLKFMDLLHCCFLSRFKCDLAS